MSPRNDIHDLLNAVRKRWRTLGVLRAALQGAIAVAVAFAVALAAAQAVDRAPLALVLIATLALLVVLFASAWVVRRLRHRPSDQRVARFIEEHDPALDDRLVSAVDLMSSEDASRAPVLAEPMLRDAAARARSVDLDRVVPADRLRRAVIRTAAAVLLVCVLAFVGRSRARQALDAASLTLFPSHVTLEVVPGNARIKAGDSLAIEARLVGNRAPIAAQAQVGDGVKWRTSDMTERSGRYRLTLQSIAAPFKYRVIAGGLMSPVYSVAVTHVPRVTRIDVDYTFPSALGLEPRTEEDSGDIYAPAGTDVRLHVHADRPIAAGRMTMRDGKAIELASESPTTFSASLKVSEDDSYRVALKDGEGLESPGDTEYFIRTLEDRPPQVHIVKPASDRKVTRLEEVDIEAQADDDYGIDRLDLVYSVRGAKETVVPLSIPRRSTTVTARHMISLENLDVAPGDFVSYYVRARDITRGKRQNEARSDIFFLEVRPFEQEFAMAQSQSMAGSGYNGSIDDLVNAQKQVVVATWKLDRRGQNAKGAQSEQDIRTVARTEADLKTRVEQTSSTFRESVMRDPHRSERARGGRPDPTAPAFGQAMPEEDAMASAATAMGKAVASLGALQTGPALPPEMEALNYLLRAQEDVKKRQVARQQSGAGGPGNNNRNYDVSTLFDKELQRSQQTNYETPSSAEQRPENNREDVDKIRELARRQDELLRKQEEMARDRDSLSEEELKRQLEKLTRDQMELRQQVEDLARRMAGSPPDSPAAQSRDQNGKQGQSGQESRQASASSGANGEAVNRLRDASEAMRSATSDLRRQDPKQASASGSRALEKLRDLERRLQADRPDERRRALGEMQLESRQIADAERQLASELGKASEKGPRGDAGADAARRLAGDQERLADRMRHLQEGVKAQAGAAGKEPAKDVAKEGVKDIARDLDRQRLADRMQKAADEMRTGAGDGKQPPKDGRAQAESQQEIARALDKLAEKLGAASGVKDSESRKLSEQLSRTQELRDRLAGVSREIERLASQSAPRSNADASRKAPGDTGRSGRGQSGGGSANGSDLDRLREQYARELRETQELLEQQRRDDPNFTRGGAGFTFEGQGMTLSAPGTEAFKQDFAKWEELRRQATLALDAVQASLSKKLQAREIKDRLAAGVEDKAPPEYQSQVDSYFKALARKKKP